MDKSNDTNKPITIDDFEKSGGCVNAECNKITAKAHFVLAERMHTQRLCEAVDELPGRDQITNYSEKELDAAMWMKHLAMPIIARLKDENEKLRTSIRQSKPRRLVDED